VQCFRCGKKEAAIDGLCGECYLETHTLLEYPEYIDIQHCLHCGALSTDGRKWTDTEDMRSTLRDLALQSLSISKEAKVEEIEDTVIERDPYMYDYLGRITISVGNFSTTEDFHSVIRVRGATCPACSRLHGHYFEAIVQVRASGREMSESEKETARTLVLNRIAQAEKGNRNVFLTEEKEVHGGIDFYISHTATARSAAKEVSDTFAGKITESKKLTGRKEGEDFYRFTFLVRLPEYGKGDFVRYDGSFYMVESASGKGWKLRSLEGKQDVRVRGKDLKRMKLAARKEEAEDAIVLSSTDEEVQVMDPATYETKSLIMPGRKGKSVRVIRIDGEIYALPDDE
jgi:nonsense-mediated mRNA decay protein 3